MSGTGLYNKTAYLDSTTTTSSVSRASLATEDATPNAAIALAVLAPSPINASPPSVLDTTGGTINERELQDPPSLPQLNITDSFANTDLSVPLNGSSDGSSAIVNNTTPVHFFPNTSFPLFANLSANPTLADLNKLLSKGCFDAPDSDDDFDGNWGAPHSTPRNDYYRFSKETAIASRFAECYAA